jgi:hypothetical protein
VSIVEMSDTATVTLDRAPVDDALARYLGRCRGNYAKSHGNYLPALDKVRRCLHVEPRERFVVRVQVVLVAHGGGLCRELKVEHLHSGGEVACPQCVVVCTYRQLRDAYQSRV